MERTFSTWFDTYWQWLNDYAGAGIAMHDPLAYGHKKDDGRVTFRYVQKRRNALSGQCEPLSKEDLWAHVRGERTFYYTSNGQHAQPLIMLDLDGHRPEQQPAAMLEKITARFPDIYHESSTGGTGFHLYVRLCPSRPRPSASMNALAGRLVKALAQLYGNPAGTLDRPGGTYPHRRRSSTGRYFYEGSGVLAKFPRLGPVEGTNETEMARRVERLMHTRLISEADIEAIEREASMHQSIGPEVSGEARGAHSSYRVLSGIPLNSTGSRSIDRLIESPDGRGRKIGAWLKLKVDLGRLPLLDEYVTLYESRYIRNLGKPESTRRRQLRSMHDYCRKQYPALGGGGFDPAQYDWVQIDRAKVDQVRKNRYAVTRELVQVICYLSEHPASSHRYAFTLGMNLVMALCRELHATGVLRKAYQEGRQICDARRVAEAYGYIEQLDKSKPGMSQKWIPGANNPHLARFLDVNGQTVLDVRYGVAAKEPPVNRRWRRGDGRQQRDAGDRSRR